MVDLAEQHDRDIVRNTVFSWISRFCWWFNRHSMNDRKDAREIYGDHKLYFLLAYATEDHWFRRHVRARFHRWAENVTWAPLIAPHRKTFFPLGNLRESRQDLKYWMHISKMKSDRIFFALATCSRCANTKANRFRFGCDLWPRPSKTMNTWCNFSFEKRNSGFSDGRFNRTCPIHVVKECMAISFRCYDCLSVTSTWIVAKMPAWKER